MKVTCSSPLLRRLRPSRAARWTLSGPNAQPQKPLGGRPAALSGDYGVSARETSLSGLVIAASGIIIFMLRGPCLHCFAWETNIPFRNVRLYWSQVLTNRSTMTGSKSTSGCSSQFLYLNQSPAHTTSSILTMIICTAKPIFPHSEHPKMSDTPSRELDIPSSSVLEQQECHSDQAQITCIIRSTTRLNIYFNFH